MRSLLFSLPLFLSNVVSAASEVSLDCAGKEGETNDECRHPMKPVTTVAPGAYYITKLSCPECTVQEFSGERENRTYELVQKENDLFFNISLTRDHRTLLLNGNPIFPSLSTNPYPPAIFTPQIPPNFTQNDLANTLACARRACPDEHGCQCLEPVIAHVDLDFDYYSKWLESHPETQTEKWEVVFDAIGGTDGARQAGRIFGSDEQSVLRIIIRGKEIEEDDDSGVDHQAASPLFSNVKQSESLYEYEIASVEFMERYAPVPRVGNLGFWDKLRRFFGNDIVRGDGHIVYLAEEWGEYGKEGSLRQAFGIIIHEWPWDFIFMVVGLVALGIASLWFVQWLFFTVKQQRELARWDGMDQVWERMRRDPGDEEDERLLVGEYRDEGYRDEPEERPPAYSDEIQTNKPLPNKPLPEKPLPAVPLIDT